MSSRDVAGGVARHRLSRLASLRVASATLRASDTGAKGSKTETVPPPFFYEGVSGWFLWTLHVQPRS